MATTQSTVEVIGGIDTHAHTHHAAALNAATGKLLGDQEFPATAKGYAQLLRWLAAFGVVVKVGMEGTGSYGAGLCRFLQARGVTVIEVGRPNRQARRLQGKSDPLDAIAAARAVLAETASTTPKLRTGPVESIRVLHTTRSSAVKARKAAINQMHGLLAGAPEALREKLAGPGRAALVRRCSRLRPGHAAMADPGAAVTAMLKTLARRVTYLDGEIADLDAQLDALTATTAPATRSINGVGVHATAQLLATAGENAHRITSEAALARLCGIAPIPASSGLHARHRLHRGGDRAANRAIHLIVVNRLRWDERTRTYAQRRTTEGKSTKDIIRCLKRAVVRELYRALIADLNALAQARAQHPADAA
jgi:transposase